jgi:hypothetical protein
VRHMRKRSLVHGIAYGFIVMGSIAALLNSAAAVANARAGDWVPAVLYLVIAVTIGSVTLLGWYTMARQPPYRWRDPDEG